LARGSLTGTVPASSIDGGRSRSTARRCGAPDATAGGSICWPRWTTPPAPCSPNDRSTALLAKSPGLVPLLANLELTGAVVTADALHTHADAAEFLVSSRQADDLFMVKANQPMLRGRCARLAWHRGPVLDRTRDRAHGRVELRTRKAVSVGGVGFPHNAQVVQVTRKTRDLGTRRWRTVVVDAVTSLAHAQASPPGSPTCWVGIG